MELWENCGTMDKNYGTIPKIKDHCFTMERNMVLWKKLCYMYYS